MDKCRHWGEESGKKSRLHLKETRETRVELEEVDSVETESCKARKFERRRTASGAAGVSV